MKIPKYQMILPAILSAVLCFMSCASRGGSSSGVARENTVSENAPEGLVRSFPQPVIPDMLVSGEDRAEYMALNFWSEFADTSKPYLTDSLHLNGVLMDEMEQKMGFFATIVDILSPKQAAKAVAALVSAMDICAGKEASRPVFESVNSLVRKYFYDPNSPVRNEDFYGEYLSRLVRSEFVDRDMLPAYGYDMKLCSLNSVGSLAADFRFVDMQGRNHSLYGISSPYTILMFSNPGCPNCKETMEAFIGNEVLSYLVAQGTVTIVNVHIDKEIEEWKAYAHNYPSSWINGYDKDYIIRNDLIYNVRAIPSLYLLDSDKRVILKDAPTDRLFRAIENLVN